jgi:hypothetical protein
MAGMASSWNSNDDPLYHGTARRRNQTRNETSARFSWEGIRGYGGDMEMEEGELSDELSLSVVELAVAARLPRHKLLR